MIALTSALAPITLSCVLSWVRRVSSMVWKSTSPLPNRWQASSLGRAPSNTGLATLASSELTTDAPLVSALRPSEPPNQQTGIG